MTTAMLDSVRSLVLQGMTEPREIAAIVCDAAVFAGRLPMDRFDVTFRACLEAAQNELTRG